MANKMLLWAALSGTSFGLWQHNVFAGLFMFTVATLGGYFAYSIHKRN